MESSKWRWRRIAPALASALMMAVVAVGGAPLAHASCQLDSAKGKIKHVVYVEFDNVHFTRDNPNVPSDMEQMPNLLNFIKQNGTLDAGDHAVLISHTANDILTTQTGLYSDNDGIFVANNFGVFGYPGFSSIYFPSSFFYWTDLVSDITPGTKDNTFALTTPSGDNVPAPWVPFTRAGCDVGAFSTANIALERSPFDVVKVFGSGSPEASDPNQFGDFIGAAIHCAIGSPFCTSANHAVNDLLPDEPDGGYNGYKALFGLKYIAPALGGITDYNNNPVNDFSKINFDPVPAQTLAVVETMLKKGVPVVFAYIADAHDDQEGINSGHAFGPGEKGYVKQLADYNAAFGKFFANLAKDGIDQTNTLFIFTPDEGDHFVGSAPTNPGCDGVTTPCTYSHVGELEPDLNKLVTNAGDSTPFAYHFDSSPTVFVPGQPIPTDASVRQLERTMATLTAHNPYTGNTDNLMAAMADPVEEAMLHMNTLADPARTPTFTFFGDPDYYFYANGSASPVPYPYNAWNHGDFQPEIARTFIGIAGPGVKNLGVTDPQDFFTDHVDLRPTMMSLLGLKDDYGHDGRVILELLDPSILPSTEHAHHETLLRLGQVYKQINAPFGDLAKQTLQISTAALASNSASDATYTRLENDIAGFTSQRDALAGQMKSMLEDAEFNGASINEQHARDLISQANSLLSAADACSANLSNCP